MATTPDDFGSGAAALGGETGGSDARWGDCASKALPIPAVASRVRGLCHRKYQAAAPAAAAAASNHKNGDGPPAGPVTAVGCATAAAPVEPAACGGGGAGLEKARSSSALGLGWTFLSEARVAVRLATSVCAATGVGAAGLGLFAPSGLCCSPIGRGRFATGWIWVG